MKKINNIYLIYYVKKFSKYTNLIIHIPNSSDLFIEEFSNILTETIIDFYENNIIRKLINYDYFYFEEFEKNEIYKISTDFLNSYKSNPLEFSERYNEIWHSVYFYLCNNHRIFLDGFINFRLGNYIKYLDNIVDISVNKYLIDKEYYQFISLLQVYINSQSSKMDFVHLIYNNSESIILDKDLNIIPFSNKLFSAKYLSDFSFSSSNDCLLNTLIGLLPKRIEIHIIGYSDDFIFTLQNIFKNRIHICSDCNICKTYKLLYKNIIDQN